MEKKRKFEGYPPIPPLHGFRALQLSFPLFLSIAVYFVYLGLPTLGWQKSERMFLSELLQIVRKRQECRTNNSNYDSKWIYSFDWASESNKIKHKSERFFAGVNRINSRHLS